PRCSQALRRGILAKTRSGGGAFSFCCRRKTVFSSREGEKCQRDLAAALTEVFRRPLLASMTRSRLSCRPGSAPKQLITCRIASAVNLLGQEGPWRLSRYSVPRAGAGQP